MPCGAAVSVLLFLLWSLVAVHSQTSPAPYLTFMGETLPDHSYMNLSLVGGLGSGNEVVCHTDLSTCCSGAGSDRGDWYFPNGDRLPFPGGNHPLIERRSFQRVELIRGTGSGSIPSGMYHCSIETTAVHSDDNTDTTTRETVYVGLYESGGDHAIIIHSDMYFKLYTACNYRHCDNFYPVVGCNNILLIIIIHYYSAHAVFLLFLLYNEFIYQRAGECKTSSTCYNVVGLTYMQQMLSQILLSDVSAPTGTHFSIIIIIIIHIGHPA